MARPTPTGVEVHFEPSEIIVSKTDPKGKITYANEVFLRVSGYHEDEILGAPHSLIRHPDMPRCVFQLLWDTIRSKSEIFAYVNNLAKDGRHYWVFAHVTPDLDPISGDIIGYHSSRRAASKSAAETVARLYARVLAEERRHTAPKAAIEAGAAALRHALSEAGLTYEQFVFHVYEGRPLRAAA
jgi:PAS domain S-box-containing protein